MTKEKMIRRLYNLVMAFMIAVSVFVCVTVLPETGFGGWETVNKPTDYPTGVDPYEVIVYEHADFVGKFLRYKLQPGMRQLLVPVLPEDMNDVISSIQVGSKVAVMVFRDADFEDISKHRRAPALGGWDWPVLKKVEQEFPIYESKKMLELNDEISSLIVFPKEMIQPLGVMLSDRGKNDWGDKFFPLPERLDQTEAKYTTLPHMNDDANRVTLFPYDPKSPAYGKVQMTLYEHPVFEGRWITLPGADGSMPSCSPYQSESIPSCSLGRYQFGDIASSLIVHWVDLPAFQSSPSTTPAPAPPATSSTHAKAPPAPDTTTTPSDRTPPPPSSVVTVTNVSGQWKSSINFVYNITQQGSQFKWTVVNSDETGEGTITGKDVSASWKGQNGAGTSAGKITVDSSGKATEIKWNNGVRFYR